LLGVLVKISGILLENFRIKRVLGDKKEHTGGIST